MSDEQAFHLLCAALHLFDQCQSQLRGYGRDTLRIGRERIRHQHD